MRKKKCFINQISSSLLFTKRNHQNSVCITANEVDPSEDKAKEHRALCQLAPNPSEPGSVPTKTLPYPTHLLT